MAWFSNVVNSISKWWNTPVTLDEFNSELNTQISGAAKEFVTQTVPSMAQYPALSALELGVAGLAFPEVGKVFGSIAGGVGSQLAQAPIRISTAYEAARAAGSVTNDKSIKSQANTSGVRRKAPSKSRKARQTPKHSRRPSKVVKGKVRGKVKRSSKRKA